MDTFSFPVAGSLWTVFKMEEMGWRDELAVQFPSAHTATHNCRQLVPVCLTLFSHLHGTLIRAQDT